MSRLPKTPFLLLILVAVATAPLHAAAGFRPWIAGHEEGGSHDGMMVGGTIRALEPPDWLLLDWTVPVKVDGSTRWSGGLGGYDDLEVGQRVMVEVARVLEGGRVLAAEVRLMMGGGDGGDGGDMLRFTSRGRLEMLTAGQRFVLDDRHQYAVVDGTVFSGGLTGYHDLEVGQYLGVMAQRVTGGALVALQVVLLGDEMGGHGYREISGLVGEVGDDRVELEGGVVLTVLPETRFRGDADRLADLEAGWSVRVWALETRTSEIVALVVWADDLQQSTTEGHDYVPFEALVVAVAGSDALALAAELGAELVAEVRDVALLLRWPRELDDALLAEVASHPQVVAVEPNYRFRDPESVRRRYPIVDAAPVAERFTKQAAVSTIGLGDAWDLSDGGGVLVAVIDNGVDPLHPVLRHRLADFGLDLVDGDDEPWETALGVDDDEDGDVDEAVGHGTFVASMVALVAPSATIVPYRVLDDDGGGTAFDLAVALTDAIARRVDVINLSLTYQDRSEVVDALLEEAAGLGIVVVAAAGNDDGSELGFPASDSSVLAVTALAVDGQTLAAFASSSEAVVLAAPGEELYGALPWDSFGTWEGTSFAAPLVSGVAALLRGLDPALDAELIAAAIVQGGRPVSDGDWSGVALDVTGALAVMGE